MAPPAFFVFWEDDGKRPLPLSTPLEPELTPLEPVVDAVLHAPSKNGALSVAVMVPA
jgi:hypothetical protein